MTSTVQRSPGSSGRLATRTGLRALATVVRFVALVFAFVLVVHIVLATAGANPVNGITVFFREHAAQLTLGIGDLFVPANQNLGIVLNFGLAAVIWILVGGVISKLLHTISP